MFPENCILKEEEMDMVHQLIANDPKDRLSLTQVIKITSTNLQKGVHIM